MHGGYGSRSSWRNEAYGIQKGGCSVRGPGQDDRTAGLNGCGICCDVRLPENGRSTGEEQKEGLPIGANTSRCRVSFSDTQPERYAVEKGIGAASSHLATRNAH